MSAPVRPIEAVVRALGGYLPQAGIGGLAERIVAAICAEGWSFQHADYPGAALVYEPAPEPGVETAVAAAGEPL